MIFRLVLSSVFALGLALAAMAAGSGGDSTDSTNDTASSAKLAVAVKAIDAGKYRAAIGMLENLVAADARNADAWNYLGYSNRRMENFDVALVAYENALAINPKHRGAHEYLGELYLQTDNLAKAKGQMSKLGRLCSFGCEEFSDLKRAIATYEAAHSS